MRIAIVGAGAIGCWLGARMALAGHDVAVLARGETLAALRSRGVRLTEAGEVRAATVRASEDAASLGVQDVVLIAVKAPALAAVAPAVAAMLGAETLVAPAMNGVPWWFAEGLGPAEGAARAVVDPDGRIGACIPYARVVGCVVHASAATQAPGHAVHRTGQGLIFGEPDGGVSPRVSRLAEAFIKAGFQATASPAVRRDLWYKLWGNMTMNPVSAITGATADRIIDDPDLRSLLLAVMAEAAETGARIGCPIDEPGEARIEVTRKLGAFRTSMLQDVDAGRAIELEALVAAPRAIAAAVGVPTPHTDMLYGLTRVFGQTRGLLP
jgi:2-dehydropantoate 2-reductase